jgi:hypothetical protein
VNVDWVQLTQNRVQWRVVMNINNVQLLWKTGNFSISSLTVSFSVELVLKHYTVEKEIVEVANLSLKEKCMCVFVCACAHVFRDNRELT